MEAIWVAAEMRAQAPPTAHSALALDTIAKQSRKASDREQVDWRSLRSANRASIGSAQRHDQEVRQ